MYPSSRMQSQNALQQTCLCEHLQWRMKQANYKHIYSISDSTHTTNDKKY